ncbi:hypothetical protein L1987_81901 [Smallanthus sonchifolius]|uniref:Uncharacterized protein n=1 Tax=Smallanthus sonchifolius TaxID=185202 RepID=A0ACB8YRU9_9ASTR|nr:hypothetical protein L1987_81901 [Smallanthus sonchifolius]
MASFPMSSVANLNFRQDLMTLNRGGSGGGMSLPGMFGGEMLETNLDTNCAKPRLPIWLENPSNSSFMRSSSSNNNNNNNNGRIQFNSLYNNYTTSTTTTPPPPAHMSASALLQKAAQMGSTRSSTDVVDTNRFGVMSTSLPSFDSSNHDRNMCMISFGLVCSSGCTAFHAVCTVQSVTYSL